MEAGLLGPNQASHKFDISNELPHTLYILDFPKDLLQIIFTPAAFLAALLRSHPFYDCHSSGPLLLG